LVFFTCECQIYGSTTVDVTGGNLSRYVTGEMLIKNSETNDLRDTSDASCRTASFACNFEDWLKASNKNATEKDEGCVNTFICKCYVKKDMWQLQQRDSIIILFFLKGYDVANFIIGFKEGDK